MNNMQNFKTIAVDFDGTLCFSSWPELGEPNTPLIEYLKQWKSEGNKLIPGPAVPAKHSTKLSNGAANTSCSLMP